MTAPDGPERRPSPQPAQDTASPQIDRSGRLLAALERLETAVSAIQDSETFRAYLDAQARFHHYSSSNVFLILAQRPEATQVAGYQTWKALGRQVRRGERGITILVPMRVRSPEQQLSGDTSLRPAQLTQPPDGRAETPSADTGQTPGRSVSPRRLRFGVGSVFDIQQTEGAPLPAIDVPVLEGDAGQALYRHLEQLGQAEGLTIERGSARLRPTTMGFYSPTERLIVVREAAQLQMTKTLAHELGHHAAGHTVSGPAAETEAESVAYVVLAHYGLDSGERSFPYVATWARDKTVLKAALSRIQQVSYSIIQKLAPLV